ncbi:hypothetical protein [Caldimonas sp. KR1-144]|uniref:hypothetical protein n=1 Tax=Caldimonas sp. KR1-144 TaxID=3400911 RepID=UPI003C02C259
MIILMTLAQQFRRSPKPVLGRRRWSMQAVVAACWAAALLVVVTSCGVLAAVGWVLFMPAESLPPPRAEAPAVEHVARAAQAAPLPQSVMREEGEF